MSETQSRRTTFTLLGGDQGMEEAARIDVAVDDALRQAVRTAMHTLAISGASEVRLDPRDHGIDYRVTILDSLVAGNTLEAPELVVGSTSAPNAVDIQFAGLPENDGPEIKSGPRPNSVIPGLVDLSLDRAAVIGSRRLLCLDGENNVDPLKDLAGRIGALVDPPSTRLPETAITALERARDLLLDATEQAIGDHDDPLTTPAPQASSGPQAG